MAQYNLPQEDKDKERALKLENKRKQYSFKYDMNMPVSVKAPMENLPAFSYSAMTLKGFAQTRSSIEARAKRSGLKFEKDLPKMATINFAELIRKQDIAPLVGYFLADLGVCLPSGRPSQVKDYDKLFQKEPVPESAKDFDSDSAFAHTFLGGADSDVLKRMTRIPENFPIADAQLKSLPAFAHDSLAAALQEGRIYYVDYSIMQSLENGTHPQSPKYMYAPLAAFAVPRGGGELTPFAIQTGPSPRGREIYTPQDGWSWKLARSTVLASANAHSAIISHLSMTHLLIEPIALCIYRNLAPTHPIFGLLQHHIVNTLHINNAAFKALIGPGQFVDRMLGSTMQSNYKLIAQCRRDFDFKGRYLPQKLASNGTTDSRILPNYAYRDDGLLLWDAIRTWVANYVSYYYRSEAALQADQEIQNWAREIAADSIGQIRNFASNGGIGSIQELIDTITMIIFTCGPQHAVVNFAQRTDMAYVPSAPMGGYTPEMKGKGHSEKDWLAFLPPFDVQSVQATLCNFLGGVYFGQLGEYNRAFKDQGIVEALKNYQSKLASIESSIESRNKQRRPFIHLLPSKIPQSINI